MAHNDFVTDLLTWYHNEKRELPWRKNTDAYQIWVSEIMLQQTKVETVIPYFERFIDRFPTLISLSEASLDEVLKYWEGLGYYSRARNLHAAVKEVAATYGGVVPDEEEQIGTLKGIGPYTKGAILSIAYNKAVPAVDGNVLRVMTRIMAIEKDIAKVSTRKEIESLLRELIPVTDPSGFNQALMELGALICIPRNPKCSICPVQQKCVAHATGREKNLPHKSKKEKKRDVYLETIIYKKGKHVLIHQRQEQLLNNLWEFPSWENEYKLQSGGENLSVRSYEQYGIVAEQFLYLGQYKHIFSHLRWHMEIYLTEVDAYIEERLAQDPTYRWVMLEDLESFAFPVPHQRVIEMLINAINK